MSGKLVESARVPIFDRLVDLMPAQRHQEPEHKERKEHKPFRTLDRQGLMRSIRLELHRLLNTRSHYIEESGQRSRTVIDYGLPDYSALYTHDPADQKRLAALIARTIETFEPRIRNVRVEVTSRRGALTTKSDAERNLLREDDSARELTLSIDSDAGLLVTVSGETDLGRLLDPVAFELADESEARG